MSILGKFKKQPREVKDFDVSYSDFFTLRSDTPITFTALADDGVILDRVELTGMTGKVVLSGGTSGVSYKVTVTMTTSTGIVKEDEFVVSVKEI